MVLAKAIKTLEVVCWVVGVALIGLYFALRAEGEVERQAAISAFEAATVRMKSVSGPEATTVRLAGHVSLSYALPDKAHWSQARIHAYEKAEANAGERAGFPVAVLSIPKVGLDVPVFAADTARNMNRGAVLVRGTGPVGGVGNTAIAAHRDGYFRVLKNVAVGDLLILQTLSGTWKYRVASLKIVKPTDISVLHQTSVPVVTLVTCYPFYFVGNAPRRFIVKAVALKPFRQEAGTSPKGLRASAARENHTPTPPQGGKLRQNPGISKIASWHWDTRSGINKNGSGFINHEAGAAGQQRPMSFTEPDPYHASDSNFRNSESTP